MQATCEKCGKTITREDFREGRYFLFWITPTIPTDSLYLCADCRGVSWNEREALFQAWLARRETGPAPRRQSRKSRKPRKTARRQAGPTPSKPASRWEDPEYRRKELPKLAQKAFELSR
jgi:hypothetical protein